MPVKANLNCIPSKPTPVRKRRTPNVMLQERIKKVEALLEQYAIQGSPENGSATSAPTQESLDFSPSASPTPSIGLANSAASGTGRLLIRDGGYKFSDSCLWSTIHDNVSGSLVGRMTD